jgi:hypothetical protein
MNLAADDPIGQMRIAAIKKEDSVNGGNRLFKAGAIPYAVGSSVNSS